jgi:hypothetical protein
VPPSAHGIVGNGCTIAIWRRCNLENNPTTWSGAASFGKNCTNGIQRSPAQNCFQGITCAPADYSITPRLITDGRKVFDIHSWPYSIRSEIKWIWEFLSWLEQMLNAYVDRGLRVQRSQSYLVHAASISMPSGRT